MAGEADRGGLVEGSRRALPNSGNGHQLYSCLLHPEAHPTFPRHHPISPQTPPPPLHPHLELLHLAPQLLLHHRMRRRQVIHTALPLRRLSLRRLRRRTCLCQLCMEAFPFCL